MKHYKCEVQFIPYKGLVVKIPAIRRISDVINRISWMHNITNYNTLRLLQRIVASSNPAPEGETRYIAVTRVTQEHLGDIGLSQPAVSNIINNTNSAITSYKRDIWIHFDRDTETAIPYSGNKLRDLVKATHMYDSLAEVLRTAIKCMDKETGILPKTASAIWQLDSRSKTVRSYSKLKAMGIIECVGREWVLTDDINRYLSTDTLEHKASILIEVSNED